MTLFKKLLILILASITSIIFLFWEKLITYPKTFYALALSCPTSKFYGNKEFHSQYYEDYILSYIFKGKTSGLFVDVGTNDPVEQNSTYYFHMKGWKGINIEPNKNLFEKIVQSRPHDININLAVSNNKGKAIFYLVETGSGLSSLSSDTEKLSDHKIKKEEVQVDTLTNILVSLNLGKDDIDFIKIDVEGYEKEVLEGMDFKKFRPKVLIVESSSPVNFYGHVNFEKYVINAGYEFGMTDDLNRYYFRKESGEFLKLFCEINKCTRLDKIRRGVECMSKYKCVY